MSYSEFNGWDPMEEDYRKFGSTRRFETQSGVDENLNKTCLYVKNIPLNLSEEELLEMMSDGGRKVSQVRINQKIYPSYDSTYGFIHFENERDAFSALNAWKNVPPYNFSIFFAREQNKKGRNEKNTTAKLDESFSAEACSNSLVLGPKGRGSGFLMVGKTNPNGPKTGKSMLGSIGRGSRIDLDGEKTVTSKHIKITASTRGDDRFVTIDDPVPATIEPKDDKICPDVNAPDSLNMAEVKSPKLLPNPYFHCFHCKKEAKYSCGKCRKPYCSQSCQVADWYSHQYLCKVAAGVSSSLLESFKSFNPPNHDSSYVSDASSSDCERRQDTKSGAKTCQGKNVQNQESTRKSLSPKQSLVSNEKLTIHPKRLPLSRMIDPPVSKLNKDHAEKVVISHIESPDRFWVQLEKSSVLRELEQSLANLRKTSLSGDQGNFFCCVESRNKIYRGKLLKEQSQNELSVYLLDYGETVLVPKNKVFELPEQFRKCPMQAIPCKLVDSESRSIQWNSEDVLSFKLHAQSKPYKALLLRYSGDVNEVSLINEDGNKLYSILMEARSASPEANGDSPLKDGIPSVWTKVKVGSSVNIVYASHNADSLIWCYLFVNDGDIHEVVEIEKLLKNYSEEDFSNCAEEGDFLVAYSPSFQEFYRCLVLKKQSKSFLVRYLDYGNEEEVTSLTALSPELAQKCSYLIGCEKPSGHSLEKFVGYIQSGAECVVQKVEKDAMQLLLDVEGQKTTLKCHPCFKSGGALPSTEIKKLPRVQKSSTPTNAVKPIVPEVVDPKIKAEKLMQPKCIKANTTYKVNVVYIKTVSELFVQLVEDQVKLNAMAFEFNKHCSSQCSGYHPQVGEVVSCKHTDGIWYRGLVQKKVNDGYNVLYVDYGEENIVSSKDIQCLPDKFLCPKFSICVSLSKVSNADVSKTLLEKMLAECWDMRVICDKKTPIEVMLFLGDSSIASMVAGEKRNKAALKQKKLPTGKSVKVKITHEDSNFVYLVLVDDLKPLEEMATKLSSSTSSKGPSNLVINNVYCGLFKDDNMWYRVSVQEKVSGDTFKVLFIDYGNSENLSINDLREIPDSLFSLPIHCIPVKVKNREGLSLDLDVEYTVEVVKAVGDVQEIKFVDVYQAAKLSSLQKRKLVEGLNEVLICHFESDVHYCQLDSDNAAVIEILTKLRKTCTRESIPPTNLHVGDVVAALSSDGSWYRASISSDRKYPTYEVLFFDYGNKENVHKENLKCLPNDLLNYPVLSIPIEIKNIQVADQDTSIFTASITVKKIGMKGEISVVEIKVEDECLPKISSLPKVSLPSDSSSKVSPCHIDENLIFVQPASLATKLEELSERLQKASEFKELPKMPEVEDVVCAKASDTLWYRGCVQQVLDPQTVKVNFIDYGNCEPVSVDNLKILPNELLSYPIASLAVEFTDFNYLEECITKEMTSFDVKVADRKGDVLVLDFCESGGGKVSVTNAYEPFFSSKLKKSQMSLNEVCEVLFIHCTGDTYYAYKSKDSDIMKNLSTHIKNSTPEAISHVPEVSEILLCRRSDNLFYRGCVDIFDSERNFGTVYFIDLGVTEDVPRSNMFCLLDIFKTFPVCVNKVAVQTDAPVFLEKPYYVKCIKEIAQEIPVLKVYHRHEFQSLKRQQLPLKETKTVHCCFKEKGLVFMQDLADSESVLQLQKLLATTVPSSIPFKPSVGELICAKSQLDNVWYRGCIEEVVSFDEYRIFFIDFGSSEIVKEQNLQCIPSAAVDFPVFCIPVRFSCTEDFESVEIEQVYSIEAQSLPSNNVQTVTLVKPEKAKDINENIASTPQMSDSSDPFPYKYSASEFVPFSAGSQEIAIYTVLDEAVFGAPFKKSDIEANLQLSEKMTDYCSVQGSSVTADCEPEPDDLVLAKYSEDNQWYRAVVIGKSSLLFDCLFVDYGNLEQIPISDLKKMEKQFMALPIQAHKCSLTGFRPLNENEAAIYEEVKKFTIFSNPEPLAACVEIKNDEIFLSIPRITAHLIEKGLAASSS